MSNTKSSVTSVIYIGSSYCDISIFQRWQGKFKQLDYAYTPLTIGEQTFNEGRITFDTINTLCGLIEKFIALSNEYETGQLYLLSSSAIREAANRDYIIEQIRVQTGKTLTILDDMLEKRYMYAYLKRHYIDEFCDVNDTLFLSNIGTGSLGTAVMSNGIIQSSNTIDLGYVKMHSSLKPLQSYTNRFYMVLEEYVDIFIKPLKGITPFSKFDQLITASPDIPLISKLCECTIGNKGTCHISKEAFIQTYEHIKHLAPIQIAKEYHLSIQIAQLLLYSLAMYYALIRLTKVSTICLVPCTISKAYVEIESLPIQATKKLKNWSADSAIACANEIAKRFCCDLRHGQAVHSCATEIFTRLKRFHGFTNKELLLLQCAAVLHECGKYVKAKDYYDCSYELIKNFEIFGLTPNELHMIAFIARYNQRVSPTFNQHEMATFTQHQRMIVSKLTAILKIAEAFDKTYQSKITKFKIQLSGNHLTFVIWTNQNFKLEEWSFSNRISFFEEVYGIRPTLKLIKVV